MHEPWAAVLASPEPLPERAGQDASDWEYCAIGERFAFDRATRGRIMLAWGRFCGESEDDPEGRSEKVRHSPDPASVAMSIAHGDRIVALSILGAIFADAVCQAADDPESDGRKDAQRILAAIEALAIDLPPEVA